MLTRYFTLDLDYGAVRKMISDKTDSEWMKRAAECSKGIHILKQDAWEALFSFIISQNNNIPRIRKIIKKIHDIRVKLNGKHRLLYQTIQ